jgi:uncharacterized protein (DUF1697 family)
VNCVALLRGVNVGGHKAIKMAELKALCDSMRLGRSQTYLQSGNIVFTSDETDRARLAQRMEQRIQRDLGVETTVLIRAAADLSRAIRSNSFKAAAAKEPNRLLVVFLTGKPTTRAFKNLLTTYVGPEQLDLKGEELFIYYRNGVGTSKLTPSLIEKRLEVRGTARNWNTVSALCDLAGSLGTSAI